jgi:hypothetical protein
MRVTWPLTCATHDPRSHPTAPGNLETGLDFSLLLLDIGFRLFHPPPMHPRSLGIGGGLGRFRTGTLHGGMLGSLPIGGPSGARVLPLAFRRPSLGMRTPCGPGGPLAVHMVPTRTREGAASLVMGKSPRAHGPLQMFFPSRVGAPHAWRPRLADPHRILPPILDPTPPHLVRVVLVAFSSSLFEDPRGCGVGPRGRSGAPTSVPSEDPSVRLLPISPPRPRQCLDWGFHLDRRFAPFALLLDFAGRSFSRLGPGTFSEVLLTRSSPAFQDADGPPPPPRALYGDPRDHFLGVLLRLVGRATFGKSGGLGLPGGLSIPILQLLSADRTPPHPSGRPGRGRNRRRDVWKEYGFFTKPDDPSITPASGRFILRRLDARVAASAKNDCQDSPFLAQLCSALLEQDKDVLALLAGNPFPGNPPACIRIQKYEYRLANAKERKETGACWIRDCLGDFCPEIRLPK